MGIDKEHSPDIAPDQDPANVPKPTEVHVTEKKSPPDTGWPYDVPSKEGGDGEPDFMHKPPYFWKSEGDKFKPTYQAACWCGKVEFEIQGDPIAAKCCHCKQCQRLHGAPFQHACLFFKTCVRLTKNEGQSLNFFSTMKKDSVHHVPCKVGCSSCHSPLFDEGRSVVLAYPSAFKFSEGRPPVAFHPQCHIFYSERSMDIRDGVPKWSGHEGDSDLLQEESADKTTMGKHKRGEVDPEAQTKKAKS